MKQLVLSLMVLMLVGAAWAQWETQYFGFDSEYEGIVEHMYDNLSFSPEMRIGSNTSSGDWEMGMHDFRAGSPPYGAYNTSMSSAVQSQRVWQSGNVFDWTVTYSAGTGAITFSTQYASEGSPVVATATSHADNRTFTDIFVRIRAQKRNDTSTAGMRVYNMTISINGAPAVAIAEDVQCEDPMINFTPMRYLWIKNVNFGATDNITMSGKAIMQWTGSLPSGSSLASQIKFAKINETKIPDVPRRDYGDAPASYPAAWRTNIGYYNPGNHYWFYLGDNLNTTPTAPEIDSEAANQPSVGADADDLNGTVTDDEDGITFLDMSNNVLDISTFQFVPGTTYQVRINAYIRQFIAGLSAFVQGWIDYNQNSSFNDPGESLINLSDAVNHFMSNPDGNTNYGSSSKPPVQIKTFQFTIPSGTMGGTTYARFILSSDRASLSPHGPVSNSPQPGGEVEDYKLIIQDNNTYDWGDLPDTGIGTGTGNYQTLLSDNGPRHVINPNIYMGYSTVDAETNGQPTVNANGDDVNGTTPDDEDGPQTALTFTEGQYALVTIAATNTTGSAATLYGFIDWNGDGDFDDLHERASAPVPNGSSGAQIKLNFDTVPTNAPSSSYARFRLSTDNAAANPTGQASNGEVEDFSITINDISTPTPIESSSCVGPLLSDVVSTDPPTSFPNPAAVGAINGRDNAFNVSVGGDFYVAGTGGTPVGGAEAEGRVLVLGDLVINLVNDDTYSMGFVGAGSGIIPDANTDHVTVGGDVYVNAHNHPSPGTDATRISLGSGSVGGKSTIGHIRYKGAMYKAGGATPAMDGDWPDPVDVASLSQVINDMTLNLTPYSNAFTQLQALSSCWASLPQNQNVSITSASSLITISSTNGAAGLYVINITSDYFDGSNGNSIQFSNFPDNATILLNMDQPGSGETFNFNMTGAWSGLSQALRLRILWHFPDAANVNFTGAELWGSVYVANSSSVTTFGMASINGRVAVSGDLKHQGSDDSEFHNYPFQGNLPCDCDAYDWGDNPDTGIGTGAGNYRTQFNNDGPRHLITASTLRMGAVVDAEWDGQGTVNAVGDDQVGAIPDDEDGVVMPLQLALNSLPGISVQVLNTTGQTAILSGWIDYNRNGVFESSERASASVPNNTNGNIVLNFPNSGGTAGATYARFRLSTQDDDADGHLEPIGALNNGEVEDYPVELVSASGTTDFGDAPTSYGSAGHSNLNNNLQMRPNGGVNVDGEAVSYYSALAHGDNTFDASDDENGVASFPALKTTNTTYSVTVAVFNNSGSSATLVAWIDFNRDGVFTAGEGVLVTVPSSSTVQNVAVNWSGLSGLVAGPTYARFRLAPVGSGLSTGTPTGIVSGGEAEDYPLDIEDPIAVDLSSFQAILRENGVVVEWTAISTVNIAGYHLLRSESETGVYERLNESIVPISGQSRYRYFDDTVQHAGYFYKLEEINLDGYSRYYGPISVSSATGVAIELPTEFEVAQNYPNPFNPTTAISYSLPEATHVTLTVYDLSGRAVRTLVSGVQPAGRYTAVWDAKNDDGAQAPSGVYIYRITAGEFTKTFKMTLLK